jgi:WD40 repeat protein
VAYSGHRRAIRLADAGAREDVAFFETPSWVRALCAVQVDGEALLASAGRDGVVRLWRPATGELVGAFSGHRGWVYTLCTVAGPKHELLVSAGTGRTIRLWNPRNGDMFAHMVGEPGSGPVFAVCRVDAGGRSLLAAGRGDGSVGVWNTGSHEYLGELTGHVGFVWALCEIPDGDRMLLASAGRDGIVRLWDPVAMEPVRTLGVGGSGPVFALCRVDVDGRTLLVAGGDGPGTLVWDPATGERVHVLGQDLAGILSGHGWVRGACRVDDEHGDPLAVTVGYDDGPRVWDMRKELGG